MNDWDRDNLNFILNASKAELNAFYDECNAECLRYLSSLVTQELSKLHLEVVEQFDEVESFDEANYILNKIKAKSHGT